MFYGGGKCLIFRICFTTEGFTGRELPRKGKRGKRESDNEWVKKTFKKSLTRFNTYVETRPRSLDRSARWSLVNLPNIWNWPNISGKFTVNVPNLWNVFVVVVVFVHHVHVEERGSEGMKEIRSHTPGLPSFFVSYKRIHNIVMTETRELRKEDNVFRNKHQMLGTHVHQVHHVHHWLKFLLRTDERTDGRTGVA